LLGLSKNNNNNSIKKLGLKKKSSLKVCFEVVVAQNATTSNLMDSPAIL
jgi:hypothetical protein